MRRTIWLCGVTMAATVGLGAASSSPAHAAPAGEDGDLVASVDSSALPALRRAGAVLVVERVETQEKSFSGMGGPTFWLRIVDVLRLDAPVDERGRQRHRELMARDPRGLLLEWDILHALDDREAAAAAGLTRAMLEGGGRFVLSATSAGALSATGVVRDGKWSLVGGPLTLTPLSRGTLRGLRRAIGAEQRLAFGAGAWSPIDPTTWR